MRKIDSIIPTSHAEAARQLGRKTYKQLNANTRLINLGDEVIGLVLHSTTVVKFIVDGSIILNSGGWQTMTTKARINAALADSPNQLVQRKGLWYIEGAIGSVDFYDGMVL